MQGKRHARTGNQPTISPKSASNDRKSRAGNTPAKTPRPLRATRRAFPSRLPVHRNVSIYRRVPFHCTTALPFQTVTVPFCSQTTIAHYHCPPWKTQPPSYLSLTNDHAKKMLSFNRPHQSKPCRRKHQHRCRFCLMFRHRHPCEQLFLAQLQQPAAHPSANLPRKPHPARLVLSNLPRRSARP